MGSLMVGQILITRGSLVQIQFPQSIQIPKLRLSLNFIDHILIISFLLLQILVFTFFTDFIAFRETTSTLVLTTHQMIKCKFTI